MGTNITRQVDLSSPLTLNDMQEFIDAAREMGVDGCKLLSLAIHKGYSDPRESVPDSVTITARP
jgi:hypothetical protein